MAARRNVQVDADRVVIVPGGKVTMAFAIMMFGEPGAEIMYPDPGFPIYRSMIEYTGATPVPMALHESKGFAFSAEEVLAQITGRTRLIIVNSPANPTGGVVPKAELDAFVAGLAAFPDVAVMSDEIYARMCYDDVPHASLTAYPELQDRLILLDGWSKTYAMTGWRLGWGVWPEKLAELATRLAINVNSCVNAPTQFAGIAALEGPQDAVQTMVNAFDQRRSVILDRLNQLPGFRCARPGGAFYAFPNIEGTGLDSRTLQDGLLNEAGVAVISGTSFGIHGEGYVRFSYAASIDAIEAAMERIGNYLSQHAA
jgi:aspartate/methionine/tyrosine aminotransferase